MSKSKWSVVEAEFLIAQDADCCDDGEWQTMRVKFVDGGGGLFPVISTQRWAVDTPSELADLIADLQQRTGMGDEP